MTDLSVVRGDAAQIALTITTAAGAVFNLTGYSIWMTAKEDADDPDSRAVFQKSTSDGITITDAPNGRATVQLDPEDTASLSTPVDLVYDVQVKNGTDLQTPITGVLSVSADVTRRTS